MSWKSWQFGKPDSSAYKVYDWLRNGINRKLVQRLLNHLVQKDTPDLRIKTLEAGSGPAYASSLISNSSYVQMSVAVDLDTQALKEARKRDSQLPVVAADIHHLPFPSNTFQLAWNSSTLEHIDPPGPVVAEMSRVLTVNGTIFIGVPFAGGPLGFQRWIRTTRFGNWIGSVYRKENVVLLLKQFQFKTFKHIYYFGYFFVGVFGERQ